MSESERPVSLRPEVMGIGPIEAIPKVLKLTGLSLSDIDLIELNEAFASQSLAIIRELELDLDKLNVNGGAIALGHPMGATGTKLTIQLMHEMKRRKSHYGMVTMCIGGRKGAWGVFANFQPFNPHLEFGRAGDGWRVVFGCFHTCQHDFPPGF